MKKPQNLLEKKNRSGISQEVIDELTADTKVVVSSDVTKNRGIKITENPLAKQDEIASKTDVKNSIIPKKKESKAQEIEQTEKALRESLKDSITQRFPLIKKILFFIGLVSYT
tara:strand:- start:47658 stop:47996 length:339 start_codon:yes stop_codon:yes gene_type:complete